MRSDIPQLQAIVSKTWGKEDELKALKSEFAALDRKITAELAPKTEEQDGIENKQQPDAKRPNVASLEPQSRSEKESMEAEPAGPGYHYREPINSRIVVGGCGATPPGGFRAAGLKL